MSEQHFVMVSIPGMGRYNLGWWHIIGHAGLLFTLNLHAAVAMT